MQRVIIIGSGLCGLSAAYYLIHKDIQALILEARPRYGGRIFTLREKNLAPLEMGATWFGDKHRNLKGLLEELSLSYFPQRMQGKFIYEQHPSLPTQTFEIPDGVEPSYRIQGGSDQLIKTLVKKVGENLIQLNTQIQSIHNHGNYVELQDTQGAVYQAQQIISTLPPYLLGQNIAIKPSLPEDLKNLLNTTHTWMGESIKFALTYAEPFWRTQGLSGTAQSPASLAMEMYDHSNYEDNAFALKGFLQPEAIRLSPDERKAQLLNQLEKWFGASARNYLSYHELTWGNEALTYQPYAEDLFPHQNNGQALFRGPWMNDRFILSGTETSPSFGGYMDGAVYAAKLAVNKVLNFSALSNPTNRSS